MVNKILICIESDNVYERSIKNFEIQLKKCSMIEPRRSQAILFLFNLIKYKISIVK